MAIGVDGDWFQVVYRKDTLYASSRYLEFSMFTDNDIEEEPQPRYKEKSSWSFSFWDSFGGLSRWRYFFSSFTKFQSCSLMELQFSI